MLVLNCWTLLFRRKLYERHTLSLTTFMQLRLYLGIPLPNSRVYDRKPALQTAGVSAYLMQIRAGKSMLAKPVGGPGAHLSDEFTVFLPEITTPRQNTVAL